MSRVNLEDLFGQTLKERIDSENTPRVLAEFVRSPQCKEFNDWHAEITRGQRLVSKPDPEHPNTSLNLPMHVSTKEYNDTFKRCTSNMIEMKKYSIDKLLKLDTNEAVSLLNDFCGTRVGFHLRERLASKGGKYLEIVKEDIEKYGVEQFHLSKNSVIRLFQIKKVEALIKRGNAHDDYVSSYNYYRQLVGMLKSQKYKQAVDMLTSKK